MSTCKIITSLVCLLLLLDRAHAQADQRAYDLQNVSPPSPNASSLGKYADWPVNLYTGLPEISVPVYVLKGRSLSVPISLSYHASGIKVGENASCVGLGWSLQAGGTITRSVRGLPDDETSIGYLAVRSHYKNPGDLSFGTLAATYDSAYHNYDSATEYLIAQGNADSEPDLYMFSALGKSYKFYFAGDGTIVTQPYSNLKITSNTSDSSWTVLMEDGTKLSFGGGAGFVEQTASSSIESYSYLSSWYLKAITSPTGEVIHFTYMTSGHVNMDGYYYQIDYVAASWWGTGGAAPPIKLLRSKVQNENVNMLTLATIESDLGRIDIDTVTRIDLPGTVAVSGIKVFSKLQNTYIKTYKLYYGYSAATTSNVYTLGNTTPLYRLKLDSLEEIPSDSGSHRFWQFAYNPKNLPSRKSFAQDYWGYYNGATTNTTFLPAEGGFNPDTHPSGIRLPDSASMMAEMLTKITYPTGGYSQFTYEPNSYPAYEEQFGAVGDNINLYLTYNQTTFQNSQTDTLKVPAAGGGQYFNFTFEGIFSTVYMQDYGTSTNLASAVLRDSTGNIVSSIYLKKTSSGTTYTSSSVFLYPGKYTFTVGSISPQSDFSTTSQWVSLQASYSYQASLGYKNVNHLAGGVRIQSIFDYDNIDSTKSIKKYYQYEGAFIVSPIDPTDDFVSTSRDQGFDCNTMAISTDVTWNTRSSSTKFSLGTIQGGTIGFAKVTEKFGPNAENGKNVYYYTSESDQNLASSRGFPYPHLVSLDYERGLLQEKDTYTAGNVLVSKLKNNYQFLRRGNITAYKVGFSINYVTCYTVANAYNSLNRVFFPDFTEQVQLTSSTEISYNTATGDSLTAVTYYYYDDTLNMQPIRTVRFNSKGDSVLVYSRTALEKSAINNSIPLAAAASTAIDSMLSRNMVGITLETEKYTKGIITNKVLTNYKVANPSLILHDNVMLQTGSSSIEIRVQFLKYDNNGNLTEQQKLNDVPHDYIYAYSATYPIAEVVNADSASIAYTSFETTETGNWVISGGSQNTTGGITGNNFYTLSAGAAISKSGLNAAKSYLVTYWSKTGPLTISGTTATAGLVKKGWTCYQHTLPAGSTSVSISGSGMTLDELRLYPADAQMSTYTFTPLVGVSAICAPNNLITYYEYDGFGRLQRVRDVDGNIIKQYDYQYQVAH